MKNVNFKIYYNLKVVIQHNLDTSYWTAKGFASPIFLPKKFLEKIYRRIRYEG